MNLVESRSSNSAVSLGLAILGILLGAIAIYVAYSGRGSMSDFDSRISELEQKVQRLSGSTEELSGQIRGLHHNTKTALQSLADQLNTIRQELKTARPPAATVSAPQQTGEAANQAPSAATSASSGRTYTIRAGDVLAKVARENGTTLDAILKANPGINPNRLKVGQVINLP
ncbi:MAG: LysM peptidoglycan-binding domain-containing protein [Kiritimatiellae bacterium]|nr:LysM peptidoglycan-binding domain-containing protein [Kiritimatiellia bacterium]MDW8459428.1 LysM domain-containing protein [Verrucomicrobiota bacterium]